jgi:K+-transporting ATPase ATPase C chain
MVKQFLPALRITVLLTIVTGFIYPGIITAICQAVFPSQANGSIVLLDGAPVGSQLIGQTFSKPEYFHGRPSGAGTTGYDGASSSGSNLGPTSRKLIDRVRTAADQFKGENPDAGGPIPSDALTASASGLDPHISPATAHAQIVRIAKARNVEPAKIMEVLDTFVEGRSAGLLGEPRVNVLLLNLALDKTFPVSRYR